MCVLSCWRCTLWKAFFLASLVYVLAQLPPNLLAENFRTVLAPSVSADPLLCSWLWGASLMPLYAWFDSGYMHCRIWQLTVRYLRCLRNTGIFGFSGRRLRAPCLRQSPCIRCVCLVRQRIHALPYLAAYRSVSALPEKYWHFWIFWETTSCPLSPAVTLYSVCMLGSTADTCTAVSGSLFGACVDWEIQAFFGFLGVDFVPLVSGCIRRVYLVRQWIRLFMAGVSQDREAKKFGLFWK